MRSLALLLSFSVGFLSLSQEIAWVRIVGFAYQGKPQAFSFVLVVFLAGIASGAYVGKKLCERFDNIIGIAAWSLVFAGLVDFSLLTLLPMIFKMDPTLLRLALLSFSILITAAAKAILFPVVHHMGSALNDRLGRSVSTVYFANILGSTTGTLLTGLVLLEWLSAANTMRLIAACTLGLAAVTLLNIKTVHAMVTRVSFVVMAAVTALALIGIDKSNTALIYSMAEAAPGTIKHLVENRHGVIHVVAGKDNIDTVFGGNVYDGHTTTDLHSNVNGMNRTYLLHALMPAPKRVLVIGLATGAWLKVLTMNPKIEHFDVVEINPGYAEITKNYAELKSILDDPRVEIHYTDGRHWLRTTDHRYDLIVMNTTWYWRAYSTNLLSQDFFRIVKERLNPGGIFAFNTTWSGDAFITAVDGFKYAYLYGNFAYASDHDFRGEIAHAPERLLALTDNNKPVFNANSKADMDAIDALMQRKFETIDEKIASSPVRPEIITDQNMLTEFKHGLKFGRQFITVYVDSSKQPEK